MELVGIHMNTTDSFNWRDEADDHLLFGDDETEFFFDEGGREKYIEQLLTITKIEELFVFVLGESGIGKTALLREFSRRDQYNAGCVYIEVPILVDTLSLLDDIAKQSDILIPPDSDIDNYIYTIRNFIQEQHRIGRHFVLIVDDADGLPDDTLRALLKLISKAGSPHFIFSGRDESVKGRITSLVPFYQTHTIEMLPLNEAEVVSYVELYLSAYRIDNNFSDDDIFDMFVSSAGNMGEINKLISASVDAQMQIDNADYVARAHKVSTPQIPRLHILAVVVAVIGLGALSVYFMNHTTTSTTKPQPTAAAIDTITTASSDGVKVETTVMTTASENIKEAPAATTTAAPEPVATTPPTAQPKPTAAPSPAAIHTEGGWLTKAPKSNFTLQIMGSFSKDSISKLIDQQHDSTQWASYQTTRDGKPWFVAVYGNYASKEAAKAAAEKLPPGLKEGKPWPKAISVIHDEMKR